MIKNISFLIEMLELICFSYSYSWCFAYAEDCLFPFLVKVTLTEPLYVDEIEGCVEQEGGKDGKDVCSESIPHLSYLDKWERPYEDVNEIADELLQVLKEIITA